MDASIREDLVEFLRTEEGDISESCADRAVTMLGKSRRGVETDERHPDAQVFKYKYREGSATPRTESDVGEDGLSKLFKCQYRENSATPRAEPDMAAALLCGAARLTLEDINEEYASADYTFSSESPTRQPTTREPNTREPQLSASPDGWVLYQSSGVQDYLQAPNDKVKVAQGARSVDNAGSVHVASRECLILPQDKLNLHEAHKPYIEESQCPSDNHLDGREISRDGKRLNLPNMDAISRDGCKERPPRNSPELGLLVDRCESKMKDPVEEQTLFDPKAIRVEFERSVDKGSSSSEQLHDNNELLIHSAALPSSDDRDGNIKGPAVEEITAALGSIELESNLTVSILRSNIATEPSLAELKSKPPKAANMDFQLMAHSVFGTGFWIEDGNDLSNLDVEGLCEVYSMGNDLGPLQDRFSETWKSALTTCHGDSAPSGERPEKTSGASSGESNSGATNQSSWKGGSRHQKRPSEGGDGLEDEDDPDPSKKARIDEVSARRFNCPFYVNDPQYFRTSSKHGNKFMVCAFGIGFPDIPRLKEHLHRVHSPGIVCARCGSKFDKQCDLETHLKHENAPECLIHPLPPPKSMTSTMKANLSRRGKREVLSDEEKWFNIYHMLFPHEPRLTTGAYRQDSDQLPTSSHEKQIHVHSSQRDLPLLLERRLDTALSCIRLGPDFKDEVKSMVISELIVCIKQISTDLPETPMSFVESNVPRNKQSGASSADSGYGSRCSNSDCMGNCNLCEQLASPKSYPSNSYAQQPSSPLFDLAEQYFAPSLFEDPAPTAHLPPTENMEDLLGYHFPEAFPGNPYFDDFGT